MPFDPFLVNAHAYDSAPQHPPPSRQRERHRRRVEAVRLPKLVLTTADGRIVTPETWEWRNERRARSTKFEEHAGDALQHSHSFASAIHAHRHPYRLATDGVPRHNLATPSAPFSYYHGLDLRRGSVPASSSTNLLAPFLSPHTASLPDTTHTPAPARTMLHAPQHRPGATPYADQPTLHASEPAARHDMPPPQRRRARPLPAMLPKPYWIHREEDEDEDDVDYHDLYEAVAGLHLDSRTYARSRPVQW
ncbi:hypothetical protein K466DRAFT_583969 [Polyporus arcularius HHB13444]|uniref:Uncharacterized protein n=1 Tax=Polyporus arcularius HHB13444 TaxID=1314778 RepID=A0A5C3PKV2_9APHY|nr:hypothetical protein K466DRAFT_583969 [Polyporus arcularius HHB13444]